MSSYQKGNVENMTLLVSHQCESDDFNTALKRRCYGCPVGKILTGLVVAMFLATGIFITKSILQVPKEDISGDKARSQVEVDSDGVYKVHYNFTADDSTTFAELAGVMLPPWYEATLMAVEDSLTPDKMKPSNVYECRKVLLTTRDLLDAFSPVFRHPGLWKSVREMYKIGYEAVGELQDLDHSGVDYSKELLKERVDAVLTWKESFGRLQHRHKIRQFLKEGEHLNQCAYHKASHLFWADMTKLPCGHDSAKASLQQLGRVQLSNAADYYQACQNYDSVLEVVKEEEFHNLRKELRIFLDEVALFGDVLYVDSEKHMDTLDEAQKLLGELHDDWTAYNIYFTHNSHPKDQKELAAKVDKEWVDFQTWAQKNDLGGVIQAILDTLTTTSE